MKPEQEARNREHREWVADKENGRPPVVQIYGAQVNDEICEGLKDRVLNSTTNGVDLAEFIAWERIGSIEVELESREKAVSDSLEEEARLRLVDKLRAEMASLYVSMGLDANGEEITPAPIQIAAPTLSASKPGVKTRDIADGFAGLRWNAEGWKKILGNKPAWLDGCLILNRARGEGTRLWNPVLIGAHLVSKGHAKPKSVREGLHNPSFRRS